MSKARVFHSKSRLTDPWGVRYRSSETTDWFPEWSDAMRKALTWARVSHVDTAAKALRDAAMSGRFGTNAQSTLLDMAERQEVS